MESRKIKILTVFILSTAVIYFVLANFYKTYRSEVEVLIVPQNGKTAVMQKQVLENAARIPLTVSFFDKLSRETINIENPVQGATPAERKVYWNSKLKTKILKDSGIVRFTANDADLDQAEAIASASATSNITTLSSYYNIKDDVHIRIIEGPITSHYIDYLSIKVILISVSIGVILVIIMFLLSSFVQNRISPQDESYYAKPLPKDTFTIKKDIPRERIISELKIDEEAYPIVSKKDESIQKEVIAEKIVSTIKTSEAVSLEKKASAPGNLPIADTSIMSMFGAAKNGTGYKMPTEKQKMENPPAGGEKKPAVYREATEEEVKERLNRLLGGK